MCGSQGPKNPCELSRLPHRKLSVANQCHGRLATSTRIGELEENGQLLAVGRGAMVSDVPVAGGFWGRRFGGVREFSADGRSSPQVFREWADFRPQQVRSHGERHTNADSVVGWSSSQLNPGNGNTPNRYWHRICVTALLRKAPVRTRIYQDPRYIEIDMEVADILDRT
jgi:hypothetical protein